MVSKRFIQTLVSVENSIKRFDVISHEELINTFYDISRVLWWEIENDLLNLNENIDKEYLFKFVYILLDFHDIIGFDEESVYRDDKYELPFEILYNIYDYLKDNEEFEMLERFKNIVSSHCEGFDEFK